jgi:hypothetical protein
MLHPLNKLHQKFKRAMEGQRIRIYTARGARKNHNIHYPKHVAI